MIKNEKNQWKGWDQTDIGFQRKFGKVLIIAKNGYFYRDNEIFWSLKEALDDDKRSFLRWSSSESIRRGQLEDKRSKAKK